MSGSPGVSPAWRRGRCQAAGPLSGGGAAVRRRGRCQAAGPLSGGGVEGDGVAERFELLDQPAGAVLGSVAAFVPVGAEVAVDGAVRHDVEERDVDVVTDRADRFGCSSAGLDLGVVRAEVAALGPHCRRRPGRQPEGLSTVIGAAGAAICGPEDGGVPPG
jgi:hypothetical protein